MDMPRLLIADSSDELRQMLYEALSAHYSIQTCRDGKQALQLLHSFRPQLLLLDLALPELDGLSLLQRACHDGVCPAVLVTATFHNAYITTWLQQLPLAYLMPKPCDLTAVADRLADFSAQLQPALTPELDATGAAAEHLLALGLRTNLDGFRYLQAGIIGYLRDPAQSMTKELYVAIGKQYRKSGTQVERSIRSAILDAWARGDPGQWRQYFGDNRGVTARPSAGELISRIATLLAKQGYGRRRG